MKSTLSVGLTVISGFVLICHLLASVSCDSCLNAVNIGDYKRSVAFAPTDQDPQLCDANIDASLWYRFDASTGGKMPESCVSIRHCGTFLPIWMNGVHPTAANPGPKSAEVCAPYWFGGEDCCHWKGNVSVRWCQNATSGNEYFVYQLKRPPFCSMSYCAGNGLPCIERDCSWNGVRNKCLCPAYPKMAGAPVLKKPRVITSETEVIEALKPNRKFFPTKFVVDCEIKYPVQTVNEDVAIFDVIFEVNGHYLSNMTVNAITKPVATLDESYLIGHLGKELTCKVSSHWNASDDRSLYLVSKGRWFGIVPIDKNDSVISSNLVVTEGETVSLWMQTTFPVTTRPCFDAPHLPCFYSSYKFAVSADKDVVKLRDCAMVFHQDRNRSVELEFSPIPTVGTKPKPIIWQLNFDTYSYAITNNNDSQIPENERSSMPIFKDYRIQSVNIEVRERDDPPQCQSIGDPHITTFPNAAGIKNYYHSFGVGVFYLVRLQSRLLEIQVSHIPCGSHYSCNCGVIAREGNSIIGITKCNQPTPLLIEYKLDEISSTGTIHTTPEGWKISLLSGIVITVATSYIEFINIYVTGLGSELTQYDGLCSASVPWNSICTSACDQYRVPDPQNFFTINKRTLPPCGAPLFVPTCSCYGRNATGIRTEEFVRIACDDPTGDYLLKIDLSRVCNKRKRRSGDSDDDDEDDSIYGDLISLDEFNNNETPILTTTTTTTTTTTRPPPPFGVDNERSNGRSGRVFLRVLSESVDSLKSVVVTPPLSLDDGRRRCREALRLSFTYELCYGRADTDEIVDTCALDVQMLNDYGPAQSVPTQLEISCQNNIRRSLDSYASNDIRQFQELKNLLTRVESLVCPSQCNQNGRCTNATCQCNIGYIGTDCSLRRGQIPLVQRIFSPLCDIHKHPCKQIHLVANDLTNPTDIVCKMRAVEGSVGDVPAVQYSTPVISGGLVLCSLPLMPITKDGVNSGMSSPVYLVQVSISNDGQGYSQEMPFTVYDGRCMECPAFQNTTCQLKGNTCSMRGRCYTAGDRCAENETRICNPSKCRTKWTSESSVNCDDGFENCP